MWFSSFTDFVSGWSEVSWSYKQVLHIIIDVESSFPALTGVLCLAYFIHNCVLSIVRNQAKPENNVSDHLRDSLYVNVIYEFEPIYTGCDTSNSFWFTPYSQTRSRLCQKEEIETNFFNGIVLNPQNHSKPVWQVGHFGWYQLHYSHDMSEQINIMN